MANTTPTTNSLENYFLPFTANKDFKKDPRLLDRGEGVYYWNHKGCLLYTSPSPRDGLLSRMPSSA